MIVEFYSTLNDLGLAEAKHIARIIKEKKSPLLCLAAGQSCICVFNHLVEMYKRKEVDFSGVKIAGLDEWNGFDSYESTAGWILDTTFFNHVNLDRKNMRMFDPNPADNEQECREAENFIKDNGGIDYLVLGVGMNGHVGFNEPGCDFGAGVHINAIADKTLEVSDKYFKNGIPDLRRGITLGFKNFFEAREIVVAINGEHKASIVKAFFESPVTNQLPVTGMKTCNRTRVILDYAAARNVISFKNV
jgi:glucosamine-6-phosphate isomerase